MRDVSGNVIPINSLKDSRGHPIVPVGLSPQLPGTVEALKAAQAENAALKEELSGVRAELAELKAEHDETLKDIGALSDSHSELQGQHEKLVEAHVELLKQTSDADEAHAASVLNMTPEQFHAEFEGEATSAKVIPISVPVTIPEHVEPEADPTPETYGEPFPLDQEKAPSAVE